MNVVKRIVRSGPLRNVVTAYQHRGLRDDDVFLASYPKSGNTWLKFMLAELLVGDEIDFVSAENVVPMIGTQQRALSVLPDGGRLIKTHEPYRECYGKAIYIVRDVRDVVISYYHYRSWIKHNAGDLDKFTTDFLAGRLDAYGTWPDHVSSWLASRDAGRPILVVRYEDMLADTCAELERVSQFLGLDVDAKAISDVVQNNNLKRMRAKENEARNSVFSKTDSRYAFVRKGASGSWKEELQPHQIERLQSAANAAMQRAGYD